MSDLIPGREPSALEARLIYQWLSLSYLPQIKGSSHFARWCEAMHAASSDEAIDAINQRLMLTTNYGGDLNFQWLDEGFAPIHRELLEAYHNTPALADRVALVCPSVLALAWQVTVALHHEPPFFFEWWAALQQDCTPSEVLTAIEHTPVHLTAKALKRHFAEQAVQRNATFQHLKAFKESKGFFHYSALINRASVASLSEVGRFGGGVLLPLARVPALQAPDLDQLVGALTAMLQPEPRAGRDPSAAPDALGHQHTQGAWLVTAFKTVTGPSMPHYKSQKLKTAFDTRLKTSEITPQLAKARDRFVALICNQSKQLAAAVERRLLAWIEQVLPKTQTDPHWAGLPYRILTDMQHPWRTPLTTTLARQLGPMLQLNTGHILSALEHFYDGVDNPLSDVEIKQHNHYRPLDNSLYQALLEADKNSPPAKDMKLFAQIIQSAQQNLAVIEGKLALLPPQGPSTVKARNEYQPLCSEIALAAKHFVLKCAYLNQMMLRVYKRPTSANSISQRFGYNDRSWLDEMVQLVEQGGQRMRQWSQELSVQYPDARVPFGSIEHLFREAATQLLTNQAAFEERCCYLINLDHECLLKARLKQVRAAIGDRSPGTPSSEDYDGL